MVVWDMRVVAGIVAAVTNGDCVKCSGVVEGRVGMVVVVVVVVVVTPVVVTGVFVVTIAVAVVIIAVDDVVV